MQHVQVFKSWLVWLVMQSTAQMVNVLPSDRPQDAYKAVAELARPHCPKQWQEHIDRGVAKRLVMTIPYNAKFKSNWGYVKEALCHPKKRQRS